MSAEPDVFDPEDEAPSEERYMDAVNEAVADAAHTPPSPTTSVWETLSRPIPKQLLFTRPGADGKNYTYIAWPVAWKLIKAKYPHATYKCFGPKECGGGYSVRASITIDGETQYGIGWFRTWAPTNVDRATGEIKRNDKGRLVEDMRPDCGVKGAESDALIRAARCHGLGIDLWIKEEHRAALDAVLAKVRPAAPTPVHESPPQPAAAPTPPAAVESKWTPEPQAQPWIDNATQRFPEIAAKTPAALVDAIKALETELHDLSVSGFLVPDDVREKRQWFCPTARLTEAPLPGLRGYLAWLWHLRARLDSNANGQGDADKPSAA